MATLSELRIDIATIIKPLVYTDSILTTKINKAVTSIAGGIRLPDGTVSPCLPDLYSSDTIATSTTTAYKALPSTYQRNVFYVSDDSGDRILPPTGGDYYDFMLFLNQVSEKDLSESGSIYRVGIKGNNLYYQGIPTSSEDITINFYRKPVDMSADEDTPDGIPDHLQDRLIKYYTAFDILKDNITDNKVIMAKIKYYENEFYKAIQDLVDFLPIDAEPVYYAGNNDIYTDGAICD